MAVMGKKLIHNFTHKNCVYFDLTLKAPITTAAEDNFCNIFPNF